MHEKRNKLAELIENVGAIVCGCSKKAVKGAVSVFGAAKGHIDECFDPARNDTFKFLKSIMGRLAAFLAKMAASAADGSARFIRRAKMFGAKRAALMQWREYRLAARRKGNSLRAAVNIIFPVASVAVLAITVNSVMSTDYGVSVEYDGTEIGVVSGEEVLGHAQCTVADRVKYYDTDGDYYVTAALSIKPLTSGDDVIDEAVLAEKMEDQISQKYDEIAEPTALSDDAKALPDVMGDKVKAYAVRVDGELIGAVEEYSEIENVLNKMKEAANTGNYIEVGFNKEIEYYIEEYVDPDEIVSQSEILNILVGYESEPDYYEVKPGDNLWYIAEEKGMTLDELCSCYATYNGAVIEDIENQILRVGTLIQIEAQVPYLQVECRKEVTIQEEVPYEVITIEDNTMTFGEIEVESEGVDGEEITRAIVTYRDGVAIKKEVVNTIVITQAQSKVIRIGTNTTGIDYAVSPFVVDGGSGEYCWPVGGGYISAHQGDGRNHKGIDIAAPYGTPIYAAASGIVTDAGTGWNGGYGNCLVIQNDDGNVTVYAHQAELVAEQGEHVEKGQLIGYVGSTGEATGNHLHFEVRKDGKYYDPELYVSQE